MTKEQVIKRLKRLEKGEYCVDENMFLMLANKSEYTVNAITGDKIPKLYPLVQFMVAFDEIKYGLEYSTKGKIRYTGTNDLNTLTVN